MNESLDIVIPKGREKQVNRGKGRMWPGESGGGGGLFGPPISTATS